MEFSYALMFALWRALAAAIDTNGVIQTFEGDITNYLSTHPEFNDPPHDPPCLLRLTGRTDHLSFTNSFQSSIQRGTHSECTL